MASEELRMNDKAELERLTVALMELTKADEENQLLTRTCDCRVEEVSNYYPVMDKVTIVTRPPIVLPPPARRAGPLTLGRTRLGLKF
jgi:hypothetical protein